MVIAISDVSQAQSLEVRPHDSEDLVKSNSETVWVDDTFNDMMACFAIGTPPLESAQEHASQMTKEKLCEVTLLRLQVLIPEENSLLMSLHTCQILWECPLAFYYGTILNGD